MCIPLCIFSKLLNQWVNKEKDSYGQGADSLVRLKLSELFQTAKSNMS